MADNNQNLATTNGGNQVQKFLRDKNVQMRVSDLFLKDKEKITNFNTSLLAMVNSNPTLAQCTPETVLNAALTAAALNLPINQNLGFAYIIPYNNNKKITDESGNANFVKVWEAQFQIGVKGFIQLAQRSGQYRRIAATPVYEGQLVEADPLMGNQYDWKAKKSEKVIGYVCRFELVNGFTNDLYMTAEAMEAHGSRYSQSYKSDKQYKNSKSLWSTDFDTMGLKTVVKLNISKWGPMNTELQRAVESDQAVIRNNGLDYIDGEVMEENKAETIRARIVAAEAKRKEMSEARHRPTAVETVHKVATRKTEKKSDVKT